CRRSGRPLAVLGLVSQDRLAIVQSPCSGNPSKLVRSLELCSVAVVVLVLHNAAVLLVQASAFRLVVAERGHWWLGRCRDGVPALEGNRADPRISHRDCTLASRCRSRPALPDRWDPCIADGRLTTFQREQASRAAAGAVAAARRLAVAAAERSRD